LSFLDFEGTTYLLEYGQRDALLDRLGEHGEEIDLLMLGPQQVDDPYAT
jgi:hypothetical protein